ncbi:profilin [Aspergillus japonicus CBS 114.51]|uniref:Profilin n=2 Tax=Aspergillus TaxID=5052 RepID=A0A2V5H561_ASPV1|nr:profilin [Aspergillus japonicus CBS 114.51]PYI15963.1 profilin [Aspergillus violaceofuscus CBS 115571]RAH86620.1 profilin [Aspergillus japonicus CBS 114.51]
MSFQGYVDSSLVGTGKIDKAAIFSGQGDSCWASSTPGFSVTPTELQAIIQGLSDTSSLYSQGIYLESQKYAVTAASGKSIYCNKDNEGVYVYKTNQTLILAHSPEGVKHEDAVQAVEALGVYLTGVGY